MLDQPNVFDGRQRGQDAPDDGLNAARGFVIGAIVGLAFWAGVILLAIMVSVAL